jgi:hypothetical protein
MDTLSTRFQQILVFILGIHLVFLPSVLREQPDVVGDAVAVLDAVVTFELGNFPSVDMTKGSARWTEHRLGLVSEDSPLLDPDKRLIARRIKIEDIQQLEYYLSARERENLDIRFRKMLSGEDDDARIAAARLGQFIPALTRISQHIVDARATGDWTIQEVENRLKGSFTLPMVGIVTDAWEALLLGGVVSVVASLYLLVLAQSLVNGAMAPGASLSESVRLLHTGKLSIFFVALLLTFPVTESWYYGSVFDGVRGAARGLATVLFVIYSLVVWCLWNVRNRLLENYARSENISNKQEPSRVD